MTEGNSAREYQYFIQSEKQHLLFPSFLWEKLNILQNLF